MDLISNLFGYVLNFIYNIVGNYGVAIILFTLLLKLVMLPITYKQQVTMKKTAKIQEKLKIIQFKYKNDPEMLNQETLALYKREKMNPLSGCLSGILQIVILLSLFYLVRSPLTYMKKIDADVLKGYLEEMQSEGSSENRSAYQEINLIREKGNEVEELYINMEFLGLDLGLVPSTALNNPEVYVIPVLYVISSIVSMRLSTNLSKNKKKEANEGEGENEKENEQTEFDTAQAMSKNMMWLMPIMSVSISMIAPLGLALYWLTNNILMTAERIIINKLLDKKEEENE